MSKSQKKTTEMVIKPSDLDLDQLSFSKLEINKNSYGQLTAYPIYNGGKLIMQFPNIALDFYGVPNKDDFHETDKDREYCQVPLDPDVKESADLIKILKSLDSHLDTPEFREKYFGDNANKYAYSPCVKVPDVKPGDKTKSGKPKITIPSIKIKISVDYDSGEVDTTFFKPIMVDGEKKRIPLDNIKTIDDVKNHALSYKSKAKFVVACIKLWAHQPKKNAEYGVTWKALKAEVEPASKSGASLKELKVSDEFLDSDSEEKTTKVTKPIAKIEAEDEDDEEDEEIVAKPVPKVETKIIKKVQQAESDDEEEDEEEEEEEEEKVVEKPKPAAKQSKKVVLEDDEEEEKPKPVAKQSKKVVVEDDEEEEEKPKPAPKKAAAKGKGKTATA